MKTIAWGILVAAVLACGAGCARPDWIEQTLVTVDVTGRWEGSAGGDKWVAAFVLVLEQQGPKVIGSVHQYGILGHSGVGSRNSSGPLEGTVAGDVFSFRQTKGPLKGEATVSGDEMTGEVLTYRLTLRRVESPARPKTQEP